MRVLVTGAAGFIGYHLSERLLADGHEVVGADNLNDYYAVSLKEARLDRLRRRDAFRFWGVDLSDRETFVDEAARGAFDVVVNLAAQAGVRHSLTHPHVYIQSNLAGFANVLEACRHGGVKHLVYASSSSVYGASTRMPFSVHDPVDHPLSLYAATKKANELMAHSYSHLYGMPVTGLRFFTVYGPWGRPDMAMYKFADAILAGRPIDVYNHGAMRRDFTYIDDIVEGIVRVMHRVPNGDPTWSGDAPDPATSRAPYRVYNIGNDAPVELSHVIALLERELERPAIRNLLPMQPGDVPASHADVSDLARDVGFAPSTSIEEGIRRFIAWYREFNDVPATMQRAVAAV